MSANVNCTECGMVLGVEWATTRNVWGASSTYYHIPDLNEHMQLHEGDNNG